VEIKFTPEGKLVHTKILREERLGVNLFESALGISWCTFLFGIAPKTDKYQSRIRP